MDGSDGQTQQRRKWPGWAAALLGALLWGLVGGARAQDVGESERVKIARALKRSSVAVQAGTANGSGFVASPERWIVTNAHVASGSDQHGLILVRFGDGTALPARLLAMDGAHDLAVLQALGEVPVPPLKLGDSDKVEVGQNVLAFGNPFGLEGTLTQGIVSARRDLPVVGTSGVREVIQTDAPINPGNSGGPLVNGRGEVIGVNTAILSRTGGSHGIGFAVPANYVLRFLGEIRKGKTGAVATTNPKAKRTSGAAPAEGPPKVWLGIFGDDYREAGHEGVRVQKVIPGSPAHAAGLMGQTDPTPSFVSERRIPWTGHIIVALDGEPVRTVAELNLRLTQRQPGQRAVMSITIGPGLMNTQTIVRLEAPPETGRMAR